MGIKEALNLLSVEEEVDLVVDYDEHTVTFVSAALCNARSESSDRIEESGLRGKHRYRIVLKRGERHFGNEEVIRAEKGIQTELLPWQAAFAFLRANPSALLLGELFFGGAWRPEELSECEIIRGVSEGEVLGHGHLCSYRGEMRSLKGILCIVLSHEMFVA